MSAVDEIDRLRSALDAERAKAEVPTEPAADLGVGDDAASEVGDSAASGGDDE